MFAQLIAGSIRYRAMVIVATAALVVFGLRAFSRLPIDAVPDLTNIQVQVLTNAPSLGPVDVERLVTLPVERATSGLPRLIEIRSLSRAGVSAVTAVFEDDVDPFFARQLVQERMPAARDAVPPQYGVPELGPMSTGLGEIYQFEVRGAGHSPMDLRTILDWDIAPLLRGVPGIVEVNVFGGELRTYEVAVDPDRMLALGVSLGDVFDALARSNRVAGGGAIERGPQRLLIRGEGLVHSVDDLRRIVVATHHSVPVTIGQVATARLAPMLRHGASTRDGRGEIVVGMAMMRLGENSRTVARAVHARVVQINRTLPRGVRIEPFYDRTALVDRTIHTVALSLAEGGVLVIVVLFLMLRNLRAGLVAAAMIPLCMLGAFVGMRAIGVSGNLMSLGALDFGLLVDGAIILLENAVHHVSAQRAKLGRALTPPERDRVVRDAALEVRGATAFGEIIVAVVYLPVLALEGVEGKMFHPMAITVLFALGTAFVLSITFVPAMASLLLSTRTMDRPSPFVEATRKIYAPALRWTIDRPWIPATLAVTTLALTAALASRLGSEFVPQLDEGSLVIEVVRLPATSLPESVRHGGLIERTLRRFPEVVTVVTKTGRPEIANDPMGANQSDVFIMLRPRNEWPPPRDREQLVSRMASALRDAVPGVAFGFSQPIQMRTNELLSGVRADFAVKIYGDDFGTLSRLGARVARVLSHVPGAADVRADRVEGLPVLRVDVDRDAIARRGASSDDVLRAVDIIGGVTIGDVLEGRRRFPLRIRLDETARTDVDRIRQIPLRLVDGSLATLESLAGVDIVEEPDIINRESGQRRLIVHANVRGRDLGGFADDAQRAVTAGVDLPPGYRFEWGGQFENLRRARQRLLIVVPLTLGLILVLLYASFRRWRPAVLIFASVPFAVTGGVVALLLRRMPFSITAAVGFIALFGVAVLNGLVLITQMRSLVTAGTPVADAARDGALRRLRPVLTTALVASLGFVPMAVATGAGSEVQRPLATVVIGGLISSTILTLLVLPAAFAWWMRRWPERVRESMV